MIKKIFFFVAIIMLTNCSFEPIFLKKNTNLIISKLELNGDKKINREIISILNINEKNQSEFGYKLILNSNKKLEIISKDKAGNPSIYKITLNVNVSLVKEDETIKTKRFNLNFTFNNMKNKFDLSQYQKSIETNLLNKITEEIFIFLNL